MKLSVLERVLLGSMLNEYKGSFTNLKLIREGREVLSFSDEETVELKFVEVDGQIKWDMEASVRYQAVDIEFSQTVTDIIKGEMLKLNTTEQLTTQHFSLYEKFVEDV